MAVASFTNETCSGLEGLGQEVIEEEALGGWWGLLLDMVDFIRGTSAMLFISHVSPLVFHGVTFERMSNHTHSFFLPSEILLIVLMQSI